METVKLSEKQLDVLKESLTFFKSEINICKLEEEMLELLLILKRIKAGRGTTDEIIEEVADVYITLSKAAALFGVDSVQKQVDTKIARLQERMCR